MRNYGHIRGATKMPLREEEERKAAPIEILMAAAIVVFFILIFGWGIYLLGE